MGLPSERGTEAEEGYERLYQAILRGEFQPNERLIEMDLAQLYNVGRAAIRTTLARLEQDGLVEREPNRGARVRAISEEEAVETIEARAVLEGLAARYAARQVARGGSMDSLNHALDKAQRMVAAGDAYAIARSSTAYHEAVVETSSNELMVRLMRTISGRITWLFYLTSGLPADEALHDHVLLRDAIASGNERVAESVAYAHIERDRQPTFEAMRDQLGA